MAVSDIIPIFATSNHISGTRAAAARAAIFVSALFEGEKETTAPGGVSDNDPKASAYVSLTARSAVILLNVKIT